MSQNYSLKESFGNYPYWRMNSRWDRWPKGKGERERDMCCNSICIEGQKKKRPQDVRVPEAKENGLQRSYLLFIFVHDNYYYLVDILPLLFQ